MTQAVVEISLHQVSSQKAPWMACPVANFRTTRNIIPLPPKMTYQRSGWEDTRALLKQKLLYMVSLCTTAPSYCSQPVLKSNEPKDQSLPLTSKQLPRLKYNKRAHTIHKGTHLEHLVQITREIVPLDPTGYQYH